MLPEVVYDPEEDAQYSFSNRKGPDFDIDNRPNIYETFLRNSLVPEYKSEYIQNPIRVATEAPIETETEETTGRELKDFKLNDSLNDMRSNKDLL